MHVCIKNGLRKIQLLGNTFGYAKQERVYDSVTRTTALQELWSPQFWESIKPTLYLHWQQPA